jgi:hypothetical protein
MIPNVQKLIDEQSLKLAAAPADTPYFDNYHTWTEVYDYIDQLVFSLFDCSFV